MKRLGFVGSILGTMAASFVACLLILASLAWIVLRWCPAPWVLWTIGFGLSAAVVAAVWHWWRLPADRRFRFSLRGMLIGVMLLALWLGLIGGELYHGARQAAMVRELAERGVIKQQFDYDERRQLVSRVFGSDPLLQVRWICITRNQGLPAILEHADELPDLDCITFEGAGVTDAGLAHVEGLNRFPELWQGLFTSCNVTGAGLEKLTTWRTLRLLSFYDCRKVTDADMRRMASLSQVRELRINDIPIGDAGVAELRDMPNLEHLGLRKTKVTEVGVRGLCEALPNCLVTWEHASLPAVSQIQQIEIWTRESPQRLLATITDRERIQAVKQWLERCIQQFAHVGFSQPRDTSLSVRFEGTRRRLYEIGLGNGMYLSHWGSHCPMPPAEDEEIRTLLDVDAADWNTIRVD